MNGNVFTIGVSVIIYIITILGLWLLTGESIKKLLKRVSMHKRLMNPKKENSLIGDYFDNFTLATLGKKNFGKKYICIEVIIICIFQIVFSRYMSAGASLVAAVMVAIIPHFILSIRLERFRKKGSLEGETLVAELLGKYRLYGGNIDKALEAIVSEERFEVSNKFLAITLSRMRQTGHREKLLNCGKSFSYGINTNWASMVAFNIGIAASEGVDISKGLEDILIQLREARKIFEERNRLNAETGRLVIFAVPLTYLLTTAFSVKYLDISISNLMKQQFSTPQGLLLATLIVFLTLANILIISLVSSRNFDY